MTRLGKSLAMIVVFLAFAPWPVHGQTVSGNCVVIIGKNSTVGDVNVTCEPGEDDGRDIDPVTLVVKTEGVKQTTTSFDMIIKNTSASATVIFAPFFLAIQDDQGQALQMNCLHPKMDCVTQQFIRPSGTARARIYLSQPIQAETTSLSFLLQNLIYLLPDDPTPRNAGFVSWPAALEPGTAALQCRERMTCEEQARAQIELRDMGYDPGRVDGVFDAATRVAIRNWQEDDPRRRVDPANGCLSHADVLGLKVRGVSKSFNAIVFDTNCKKTDTNQPSDAAIAPVPQDISVQDVQKTLARIGFYQGGIDGAWGDGSRRALLAAQKKLNIQPTGTLDDGMRLLARLNALPDPPDCQIRFSYFDGELFAEPDVFAPKIGNVSQRSYDVLDQRVGASMYWFQINTGSRIGWVKDFGHISLSGPECRQ